MGVCVSLFVYCKGSLLLRFIFKSFSRELWSIKCFSCSLSVFLIIYSCCTFIIFLCSLSLNR